MSATWISCPWACWAVFVSALFQLNHWVDPRGFHHPNADYGLSFQLWATAAALIQKEDKIWVEQTLLWAVLPPSWKMVRHTSVWRHFNKKRCIFERRKGTLKKKYCNLEKYIKLIWASMWWMEMGRRSELIRHAMEEAAGCLVAHLRKFSWCIMLHNGSMMRGDCCQRGG